LNEKRLRVCAYCRVSTDQAEQKNSFSAQVEHYTAYIKNNAAWEFAGIYADEALSGKNAAKRPEFTRMVNDAENNKIDLIITKWRIAKLDEEVASIILQERALFFIEEKGYAELLKGEHEELVGK
jgi:DNA invertase Pin-like site-specific DNA recombinase